MLKNISGILFLILLGISGACYDLDIELKVKDIIDYNSGR